MVGIGVDTVVSVGVLAALTAGAAGLFVAETWVTGRRVACARVDGIEARLGLRAGVVRRVLAAVFRPLGALPSAVFTRAPSIREVGTAERVVGAIGPAAVVVEPGTVGRAAAKRAAAGEPFADACRVAVAVVPVCAGPTACAESDAAGLTACVEPLPNPPVTSRTPAATAITAVSASRVKRQRR